MARGGDVFVLDMGDPVKIDDLAHRMVSLMGLTVRDKENPNGDIEILYTGLRPAEKLYEELLIGGNVTGTDHPRILRAAEHSLAYDEIAAIMQEMQVAIDNGDHEAARHTLAAAVREYSAEVGMEDLVWRQRTATAEGGAKDGTVVPFPKDAS